MNLNKIKEIIEDPIMSDSGKKIEILNHMSEDPNILTYLIHLLSSERNEKRRMFNEASMLLGKAHVLIKHPELGDNVNMNEEILRFYKEEGLKHPFNLDKDEKD